MTGALLDTVVPRGVSAIYGPSANLQAFVAEEVALRAAHAGRSVAVLVESKAAEDAWTDHVILWRRHNDVPIGERMMAEAVNLREFRHERSVSAAVLSALKERNLRPNVVASTALASEQDGFHAGHAALYWNMAEILMGKGCAVLLAGHTGHFGKSDGLGDHGAALWHCAAGRALGVVLTGPAGQVIKLTGRDLGGPGLTKALAFDDAQAEAA